MRFKKTALFLSLIACTAGVTAQASDTGMYIGGRYGLATFSTESDLNNVSDVSKDQGFKGLIGYKFTPMVSLRAEYTNFGEPDIEFGKSFNGQVEAASYGLAGVFHFPVPILNPYAKVGMQNWHLDNKNKQADFDSHFQKSGSTNIYYGVGTGIKIFPYTTLEIEYEKYTLDTNDIKYLSAGLTFNF